MFTLFTKKQRSVGDIKLREGDRWFCSAVEAENAGFRASEQQEEKKCKSGSTLE